MTVDLKRVRAERVACGFTQEEVAEKMGWSSRTPYAKRENGIVSLGADELIKLAIIFGYNENELSIFFKKDVPE